jgi:hypothetical protein
VYFYETTSEVSEVAERLNGKSGVLIGGACRPRAKLGLEKAFRLTVLDWIEGRGVGRAFKKFKAYIARPDVAVVLLAIRWSSHSFGKVKKYCDKYGKPIVWLPAGYNPNQVAHQILIQCGDRLAARKELFLARRTGSTKTRKKA